MLVLSAIVLCAGILVNILLGCERTEVLGVKGSESLYSSYHGYSFQFNGSYCDASAKCDCAESQFIPVCDPKSGVNFYSPCHAGCTSNKTVDEVGLKASDHQEHVTQLVYGSGFYRNFFMITARA